MSSKGFAELKSEKLPLYFIRNEGQLDRRVKYYARTKGSIVYFAEEGAYFSFTTFEPVKRTEGRRDPWRKLASPMFGKDAKVHREVVRLSALGGAKKVRIEAEGLLESRFNYFIGNDPKKWHRNVAAFRSILYKDVYPRIDVRFYERDRQVEYDIIVRPGGDPSRVKMAYEGIRGLWKQPDGDLAVELLHGQIIQRAPVVYQEIDGARVSLKGEVRALPGSKHDAEFAWRFEIPRFNKAHPLILDPVLSYSTYLGGSADDEVRDVNIDSLGFIYLAGLTSSQDFRVTSGSWDIDCGTPPDYCQFGGDAFVTKLSPDGQSVVFSTFLGGSQGDGANSISVDANGRVYVMGQTGSDDFPTRNPVQAAPGGSLDVFVAALTADGSDLVYSTYFGGSDYENASGMAASPTGTVVVGGQTFSRDFPVLNALQSQNNATYWTAFLFSLDSQGALVFSTYLGGSWSDEIHSVALDPNGNPYVCGHTDSADFPVTQGAFETSYAGGFVSKIASDGSQLLYSTFLGGGGGTSAYGIGLDAGSNVYVTGVTFDTDFPVLNAFQPTHANPTSSNWDVFLTKFVPELSALIYSTYLGGDSDDQTYSRVIVDQQGGAYVAGNTHSGDSFPTQNPTQSTCHGSDAFVARFSPEGNALIYSTCVGGSQSDGALDLVIDTQENAYIVGATRSSADFPLVNPLQTTFGGGLEDGFISRISFSYLLYDDFEDGILDWQVASGKWQVVNGSLTASRKGTVFAPAPWDPSGESTCGSCTIEAQMQSSAEVYGKVFLIGWHQDNKNQVMLIMDHTHGKWVLKQRLGGITTAHAKHRMPIDPERVYTVKLSTDGKVLRVYVDGSLIITMPAAAAGLTGNTGFKVKNATGTFGKIEIY